MAAVKLDLFVMGSAMVTSLDQIADNNSEAVGEMLLHEVVNGYYGDVAEALDFRESDMADADWSIREVPFSAVKQDAEYPVKAMPFMSYQVGVNGEWSDIFAVLSIDFDC